MSMTLRQAVPEDAEICGRICFDAFSAINTAHNFPCDFPSPEFATGVLKMMFSSPAFFGVVAEADGQIIGSNVVTDHGPIAGIGPITVEPSGQNRGAGRRLMEAVMNRARERGATGTRLVQAAFHNRSLSLYASLGFDVREPLSCMQGGRLEWMAPGCAVRRATIGDLAACNNLSVRVHGFDRGGELAGAIEQGTATVCERDGRITGYSTDLAFFGHTTAETDLDLQALIGAAPAFGGPGFLLPSRNTGMLRWCLAHGLRVVQPMTLMSMGLYNEPRGAWLPSILF